MTRRPLAAAVLFLAAGGAVALATRTAASLRSIAPAASPDAPAAVPPSPAAPPAAEAPAAGPAVLRSYDVADLLDRPVRRTVPTQVVPPTAPPRGYWTGGGGGLFGQPPNGADDPSPPAHLTPDALTGLIHAFVAAGTWRDGGGDNGPGVIRFAGSRMFVSHTPAAHRELESLLAVVRENRPTGKPLAVEARWFLLGPAELAGLLPAGERGGRRAVDEAALDKLPAAAVLAHARFRCRSSDAVQSLSGRAFSTVVDVNATVDGPNKNEPEVQRLLAGTALAVAPTLRGRVVAVDVVATFSEWDGPAGPAAGGPTTRSGGHDQHGVDRLDATVQHLATTAELPLDKPVIVGGMTLRPRADDRGDRRQLYLVLRVSVE